MSVVDDHEPGSSEPRARFVHSQRETLGRRWLAPFLRVAIGLAHAVARLHKRCRVHIAMALFRHGRFDKRRRGELTSYTTQIRIHRKDGQRMWVRLSVSLGHDSPGEPPHAIGIVDDISERRRLEHALQLAKDAAETSNRARDEFLANVSHEIRTPMNAILGMTELVLDTELSETQRQSLRTVKSAASDLLAIINDLLDFSTIEAGKLQLEPIEFRLRALLGDTMQALAMRAHRKGLELVCHVAPDVPDLLVGDAGRLRQVLTHLVGNAIKFTTHGEVQVDVSAVLVTDGTAVLRFVVRDTGIGIPLDKQEAIFRAFEQEDMSTTRRYGGTGLGLTIASRLVVMMGGAIKVESTPKLGSTFSFDTPFGCKPVPQDEPLDSIHGVMARAEPSMTAAGASSVQTIAEAAHDTALPLRVLVAEDNSFNAQLLHQLLASRGHAVRIARDGREALRLALGGGFDLLLLDLHMPELDGFGVIAGLREHERVTRAHLPVIALTARSRAEDRQRCFDAGMDDFLAKPIHAAALWSAIERRFSPAGPDAPPPRLISPDVLLAACGGDAAILQEICDGLRTVLPGELAAIQGALRARDARQLRELAHGIAGVVAAFSTGAAALASELEDAAAAGDLDAAALLVERLAAIAPALLAALVSVSVPSLAADLAHRRT